MKVSAERLAEIAAYHTEQSRLFDAKIGYVRPTVETENTTAGVIEDGLAELTVPTVVESEEPPA